MIKGTLICVLAGLMLAACGHVVATEVENEASTDGGDYELRYEYGAVDSHSAVMTALAAQATELCPDGWTKTKETLEDQGAMLAPVYVWQVRCAGET